jgi:hypothetical protein
MAHRGKYLGVFCVFFVLLGPAVATQVTHATTEEPHFDQLLIQLKSNKPDADVRQDVQSLIDKADRDMREANRTCQLKEHENSAKASEAQFRLQSLKTEIETAEKDVESTRDKINADMGLIQSLRLMLKAQQLKHPTASAKPLLLEELGKKDATSMLTSLLQAPPSTPEDMKKVHELLDRLEAKLKKQLADHSTKARLNKLQKQKEEASVKFAMLEQQAAEYALGCARNLKSLKTFKGLAQQLLTMKNCKPAEAVAASPVQDCVQQEKKAAHALTKCATGANSLRMEVARIQKQSKQSLADMKGSLATCLYEKKALGKQQQFRTFKSYVYGKLQELVKSSTIAVERERTVTSTVRKENTDLRMRLEAAYETSKRGMLLRDLTTKNKWCQEQLAHALHANATSA